ncbi:sn-glycerol-3-phosphate ABC transporter ATP-binding protein UgpC [uncultured Cohaesibacter sp.]|uniref:ABC transporter ATP-binding protein n=1 Tax=uncultured Cohaesibacter sp. TaxID=1002546 RepID=UPI00292F7D02|nr:sn-glycerol-3-phosphate ABC transporter ATP-binding protein UgpC [uncultured Cohaesibacter sp.]
MSSLELKSVRKSYGVQEVIKGVDLSIKDGEFTVFVGPSGCGKSTLLRMIAGLDTITKGELLIDSSRVNDVEPALRGIAMVFQSYALYPHMTVQQNMEFALKRAGMPKPEVQKRVKKAAGILGLDALMKRKPKALSGGQRQRVAIGRAIVREPGAFLFDEPLSNLDAELRVHMRVEISKLHKELKSTIIYVTHDQVEAMTLADKIVVLRDGKVEQIGSPLELYDHPDNTFVAGFIGSPSMNFFEATVMGVTGDGLDLQLINEDGPKIKLPKPEGGVKIGQVVKVGIRPEHFGLQGDQSIPVTLDLIEHLGGQTFGYGTVHGSASAILDLGDDRNVRSGSMLDAKFESARAHLFDMSGQRI